MTRMLLVVLTAAFLFACKTGPGNINTWSGAVNQDDKSANYYLQEAEQQSPEKRASWYLKAASLQAGKKNYTAAAQTLARIDTATIDPELDDAYALLLAEVEYQQENYSDAATALRRITNVSAHSLDWQIHYQRLRADIESANQDHFAAVRTRNQLEDLLTTPSAIEEQHRKIWEDLSALSTIELEGYLAQISTPRLRGWLELFVIQNTLRSKPGDLRAALEQWEQNYPLHPAQAVWPDSLNNIRESKTYQPRQIALLLPLSGRLASTGNVIREGFMAAYYAQDNRVEIPSIQIYDTTEVLDVKSLISQAYNDGAEFVVGPLMKEAVDSVATIEELPVPVLSLNTLDEAVNPAHFYQFGLPVEDEARQIAEDAWSKGRRAAVVVSADAGLGQRAINSFNERFSELGGLVVRTAEVSGQEDPGAAIKNLLGISQSESRKQELERILGTRVEYTPQRRQDADMVFMIARTEAARKIKPYLDYYYAYDLPVYATSHVYSGILQPQFDKDINGVIFPSSPWVLGSSEVLAEQRERISRLLPGSTDQAGQLFALGYDAYNLIAELVPLSALGDYQVEGISGQLTMDNYGVIHRRMPKAQFDSNGVKLLRESR